ncbi:MAG: OmpA family protein [Chitinophagaceae bacterium]|nr:OmpA family protein [Chitinophagaceae bacterium]
MRILGVIFGLLFIWPASEGQILKNMGKRIEQKVKQRAERKVDQTIDKGLDKIEGKAEDAVEGNKNANNKQGDNPNENANPQGKTTGKGNSKSGNETGAESSGGNENFTSLKVDSKFDFVPGEKVVLFEDFSKDNIGDFPHRWNTNGSGEVVTTNKAEGRFLETRKETVFYPEWVKSLPDNFTLEFDLMSTDKFSYYSESFTVGFTTNANIGKNWARFGRFGNGGDNDFTIEMHFDPTSAGLQQGESGIEVFNKGSRILNQSVEQNIFKTKDGSTKTHISIWRQKQRIRVYINDKKVWDLPRAIEENVSFKSLYFRNSGASNENDAYYIGNIRLAVGQPDTRNKLITEGRFSTVGILFNVNSDKIKPESYGTLKEIANLLSENPQVRVKIIGHTDSDGDDAFNMELSKRRAQSVKNALSSIFGIDASRMETEGKGESQPMAPNDTPENKAQNRRVEFLKL